MPTLNKKENYLRMLSGQIPEYVPMYAFNKVPGTDEYATLLVEPDITASHRIRGGGPDVWGVNYVATYETGNALIPEPNNFILKDVTKWRDVIKAPPLSGIDWERMAASDVKRVGVNRAETAVGFNLHFGYFQTLMSFTGFENGLMAMYEEPEAVHEILDYIADFYTEVAEKYIDFLKPDICTIMDDTAAWGAPFISPEMYREFIMPRHKRFTDLAHDRDLFTTMHNCGKCEGIVEQFVELGITLWEPAQTCNDLVAIKAKYPIAIAGGWDGRGRLVQPDVTEEEIRQSVRDAMNKYGRDGRFAWFAGFLGPVDDPAIARNNIILANEAEKYGAVLYK